MGSVEQATSEEPDIRMLVLPNGFIYVGVYKVEGHLEILNPARNVMIFDHTDGLAGIAKEGPQPKKGDYRATRLGAICDVDCHVLTSNHRMKCVPKVWKKHLGL